jgi:hypothetical protein
MTVSIIVSKLLSGTAVADSLLGGGSGVDLGDCINNEYAPIISKAANTGHQKLYIRNDAVVDPITDVGTFVQQYTQTYGGANSAAADYSTLIAKGSASSTSANNSDGLGGGLRIEHDADLGNTLGAAAFDGTRPQVKIYGKSSAGINLDNKVDLHVDALIYDSNAHGSAGTPVDASAPETGKIGKNNDSVLGDHALIKLRMYLEDAATEGGTLQFDYVITYAFSA